MTNRTDEAITGEIVAAFAASPRVHSTNVRVHADRGWIRLEAVVDTLEEKTAAEGIAERVDGVLGIENDIVVSSNGGIADLELERRVGDHLIEEGLAGIGARVEAGTVFLMGIVPSLAQKRKAVGIASAVQGVRDVLSELEIAAGEPVDDTTLANDVAEALSDDLNLDVMNLHVWVKDATVLLAGRVPTRRQLEIATDVATAVPGVQYLRNHMMVQRKD